MPSSTRHERDSGLRIRIAPEEVTLFVWPMRQRPAGSLLAFALAAAASWLVGWSSQRLLLGLLAAAVLALTLWRTWLPVAYEVGIAGVTVIVLGRRRRIPWTAIRSYQVRDDGVLLSPDAQLTPLAPLRGLYLPWLHQRDKVLANVEYYLQNHASHPTP
jgi:hypothetical protein